MSEASKEVGWVKMFHPSGALVTLPVPAQDYTAAFDCVTKILEAGFMVQAPGLEAGEEKEMAGWFVRMTKTDNRGTTNVLHLYSTRPGWNKPFLTVYLNNRDDCELFRKVSGLDVEKMPKYIGAGRLERNSGNSDIEALIVKAPKPVGVVFGPNPKYDPAEAAKATQNKPYTIPKKKFKRWADAPADAASGSGGAGGEGYDATRELSEWKKIFDMNPPVDVFNRKAEDRWEDIPEVGKPMIQKEIHSYAKSRGWVWDKDLEGYVDPSAPAAPGGDSATDIPF